MKRTFYHGTSRENYQKILKEGVLWGLHSWQTPDQPDIYRHTYLTECLMIAEGYAEDGGVVLKVQYDPSKHQETNYPVNKKIPPHWDNWQFLVWHPIELSDISKIQGESPVCSRCANRCSKLKTLVFTGRILQPPI
jgi:hypothetical protein